MKALLLTTTLLLSLTNANALEVTKVSSAYTALVPLVSSALSYCAVTFTPCTFSKEVVAVKHDAQDYLVGEGATETLLQVVDSLKSSNSHFSELSDEEVIQIIATLE